jgi:prolyl-tRNA synthetase
LAELGVSKKELTKVKSAEVGNIFNFGTAKCDDMKLFVTDNQGKQASVYLGSYGIGVTRLMGVVAEHFADQKGMSWPKEIAPFAVHLLSLNQNERAEEIYDALNKAGVEVLFVDRDANAGVKFADADLMGMPYQLVVSEKNIRDNRVEIKNRKNGAVEYASLDNSEIVKYFGKK